MEHHESFNWLMEVILPWANFALFFGAAVFFFRKMVIGAAGKKRTDFEAVMAEAKAARLEAAAKLAELETREANLNQEIAKMQALSKSSAETEAAKIVSDGARLADHLRAEAQRIAAAEVDKARSILRDEIVTAVRDAVAKKMKTDLNDDAQQKIVRKRIGELKTLRAEG